MPFQPIYWPHPPVDVLDDFYVRTHLQRVPQIWWAVGAAEGVQYLSDLDQSVLSWGDGRIHIDPDMVDATHVRWATGTAITAIDLLAAAIGRLYCANTGNEYALTWFDVSVPDRKMSQRATERMTKLPAEFAQWVTDTLADSRYLLLKGMRDPFTHSWLKLDVPRTGPTVRTHQARVRFYDSTGADQTPDSW